MRCRYCPAAQLNTVLKDYSYNIISDALSLRSSSLRCSDHVASDAIQIQSIVCSSHSKLLEEAVLRRSLMSVGPLGWRSSSPRHGETLQPWLSCESTIPSSLKESYSQLRCSNCSLLSVARTARPASCCAKLAIQGYILLDGVLLSEVPAR